MKTKLTEAQKSEAFDRAIDSTPTSVLDALYRDSQRPGRNDAVLEARHAKRVKAMAKKMGVCQKD